MKRLLTVSHGPESKGHKKLQRKLQGKVSEEKEKKVIMYKMTLRISMIWDIVEVEKQRD